MIKKIKYLLVFTGLILAVSCNKKLDIAPENTLVERDVFKTEAGAEQALSESYYNFFKAECSYFAYIFGDITTANLSKINTSDKYDLGQAATDDYNVVGVWTAYFKALNSANNIITKIPLYGQFSDLKEKQFIAEGKFIRAFCFLNLLRLYGDGALSGNMGGLGLPLQLTPFEGYNTGEIIPRSNNGEVYAQIIKDLQESLADLPLKQADDTKTRSRGTKGSANALLARTYLYMGRFGDAADAAKLVLDLRPSTYSITTSLRDLFPSNPDGVAKSFTPEIIMGFPISQVVSSSTSANNGIGNTYYFKRSYWINDDFISQFEPGDFRVSQLMWKGDSVYNTNMLNAKTTFKFNNPNGRDNVPMIRLAEIMLTRAEALVRSTSTINQEAVNLLNQVRNRSLTSATPFTVNDFGSPNDLIQKILLQRRFELACEGFYRYDLIRTGQPLHNPDIPQNRKVLPIPQVEVDISHGLIKQNTGY